MDPTLPEANELEISVFGRGYGEAICVHIGDGEWVLVDSCINPETRSPAAPSYLSSLGLSPDAVVLVVITHWDDDHIQGAGAVVQSCSRATVALSAALHRRDIYAFVLEQERVSGALSSGLDEFRTILEVCAQRKGGIVWAKANTPLYPRPPGDTPAVVALSPSEDAFERSLVSLIEAATSARSTVPRRYRAPEGPNGASVATWVKVGGVALLLGADLEVSANDQAGWDAVLTYSKPATKASVIKVPHHGSFDAHHDEVWSELGQEDLVAILTPWSRGAHFLPTQDDLDRIRALARRAFLTSTPSLTRAKNDPELDRMIRRLHGGRISQLRGWGHVRARRKFDEHEWRVELDRDAVALN